MLHIHNYNYKLFLGGGEGGVEEVMERRVIN